MITTIDLVVFVAEWKIILVDENSASILRNERRIQIKLTPINLLFSSGFGGTKHDNNSSIL
jgi:hypothetical protein